ncbi:class I SAM-dependent methyltransferase [Aquibacillus rhizosphaerae]|uniref:Class I SAM-dependent methyltransferase n=1 Tax=Aquibacillus rhizosphaerae TaxID=3051431 RepID=A0ABT7LEQ1_9BACI|nr:class I SAM-dependent methyltransferase [Aquibacillus sp. LR5S19]MDL4843085.1 class I SAM-dependent methyltransferase [Aquibacillus sp. LR5S19]
MSNTHWQRQDITNHYLEQVRGAVPFGAAQTNMMLQVVNHFQPTPTRIMDLGCGNGILAEVLLQTYPESTAILVDHSEPMVEAARLHMEPYKQRCEIFHGDLYQSIKQFANPNSVDCIISGYAIHHLSHQRKKELYKEIYDLLAPGGLFINVEHTASATPELERLHDELFISHLATHNKQDREEVATAYFQRPDKDDNILEKVDIQVDWLRKIGFNHADCYFKWMELAVFGGVK